MKIHSPTMSFNILILCIHRQTDRQTIFRLDIPVMGSAIKNCASHNYNLRARKSRVSLSVSIDVDRSDSRQTTTPLSPKYLDCSDDEGDSKCKLPVEEMSQQQQDIDVRMDVRMNDLVTNLVQDEPIASMTVAHSVAPCGAHSVAPCGAPTDVHLGLQHSMFGRMVAAPISQLSSLATYIEASYNNAIIAQALYMQGAHLVAPTGAHLVAPTGAPIPIPYPQVPHLHATHMQTPPSRAASMQPPPLQMRLSRKMPPWRARPTQFFSQMPDRRQPMQTVEQQQLFVEMKNTFHPGMQSDFVVNESFFNIIPTDREMIKTIRYFLHAGMRHLVESELARPDAQKSKQDIELAKNLDVFRQSFDLSANSNIDEIIYDLGSRCLITGKNLVIGLLYVYRLMYLDCNTKTYLRTGLCLTSTQMQDAYYMCLLLSTKHFNDVPYDNASWCRLIGCRSVQI